MYRIIRTEWCGVVAGRRCFADMAAELHEFVLATGRALSLAGTAVTETQQRLTRIAAANGADGARIVVFPTALLIALEPGGRTTVESVPQLTGALRLDQIAALYEMVRRAERGGVGPAEGLRTLGDIRSMTARRGRVAAVASHSVMTAALCLILQPTPRDVLAAGVLGALVGCLVLIARGRQPLQILIPVVSAFLVSGLTFLAVRHGVTDPGLRTLVAPLVTFLPGAALATATVELASGEMVAGASRLVTGAFQLLLLAFGIVAGADLAGVPRPEVLADRPDNLLGWWAPWLGVVVFGVAVTRYFSAPKGALRWNLLVLMSAWVGQYLGGLLVGAAASGFIGAFVMTPVALAVAQLPGGPPSQVTFLPAFWMLAPGAISLLGVTRALGDPTGADAQALVQPLASIVAIALGVLCGAAVHRVCFTTDG